MMEDPPSRLWHLLEILVMVCTAGMGFQCATTLLVKRWQDCRPP